MGGALFVSTDILAQRQSGPAGHVPPSCLLFGATPRLQRLLFKLIREPAEFMGNIWCTQSEPAETIGNVEQIRNQTAIVFVGKARFRHSQECGMPTLGKELEIMGIVVAAIEKHA